MGLTSFLDRRRHRAVWADPVRRLRTLESFSRTEEDGGKDLVAAARRVSDPELRLHLERHAEDEVRHAALFRTRADEVRVEANVTVGDDDRSDLAYDLSRGRPGVEVDAHGFFNAGLYDELGEVAYVAMLHTAEKKAAYLFEMHRDLTAHDPKTREVFEEILKDEKYHVAYTGRFLDKWRAAGREREVAEGLKSAKASRMMGAWKRLGIRSAAGIGKVLLYVLYFTILLPFGFIASRRNSSATGWQAPRSAGATADGFGQY